MPVSQVVLAKRCGAVSKESLVSFNQALVDQMPVGQVAFGQKMLNRQQRIITFIQSSSC